jgi:hypothetical protein
MVLRERNGTDNNPQVLSYDNLLYTDKKENQIFLICKEIQKRAVSKSSMTNGLLIYG